MSSPPKVRECRRKNERAEWLDNCAASCTEYVEINSTKAPQLIYPNYPDHDYFTRYKPGPPTCKHSRWKRWLLTFLALSSCFAPHLGDTSCDTGSIGFATPVVPATPVADTARAAAPVAATVYPARCMQFRTDDVFLSAGGFRSSGRYRKNYTESTPYLFFGEEYQSAMSGRSRQHEWNQERNARADDDGWWGRETYDSRGTT